VPRKLTEHFRGPSTQGAATPREKTQAGLRARRAASGPSADDGQRHAGGRRPSVNELKRARAVPGSAVAVCLLIDQPADAGDGRRPTGPVLVARRR